MAQISNPFAAPSEFSNVVLIVEGQKLHVNKELLSIHSPVLAAMFFGDFAENGKEEIEIKDVFFNEFVDLLNVIHPNWTPVTAATFSHILKLADQFQMKSALDQAENFLLTSQESVAKKLLLAEQYKLQKLKNNCIDSFNCVREMCMLKNTSEFNQLSDATKISFLGRMMGLGYSYCRCNFHAK